MSTPIEQWVEALRSGKYKQGRNYLHTEDSGEHHFCCLGVLCEIARENGVDVPVETIRTGHPNDPGGPGTVYLYGQSRSSGGLPDEVQNWVGLGTNLGNTYTPDVYSLSSRNDNGTPFDEIADIIESRPYGLFVEPKPISTPADGGE